MSSQKPRSGNAPLLLAELNIPGAGPAHPPMPADTLGINIAAAWLNFPHDGLKLIIPHWPTMNVGDSYRVKLNNIAVLLDRIERDEQVDEDVERYLARGILSDGAFVISYDVTRIGSSTPEPSEPTNIYVKIEAAPPGGKDQDGDVPGHSELRLIIPDEFLPPAVVDKDAAAQGIPVTIRAPYPEMFEGDRIRLSWGGEFVEPWHRVTKDEVLDPTNNPIVIVVDEKTILAAQDTDESGLAVAFEVYDVVDNKSEDWSAEVRVIVDTGNSRLPAPLIKEVVNLELDMDKLGDADLTYQIIAVTNDFARGDQIEIRLSGITASGDKVDKTYPPEEIKNVPSVVEFTRSSTDVRALVGGIRAAFYYRLIKADGSEDLFSKIFSPRVIGRSTVLAAPIAVDEIAGTLAPDLPNTQVDIPWDDDMVAGNVIMLVWEGKKQDGSDYVPDLPLHPITDQEEQEQKPIEITVAGEHLKAIENGRLDLYYWLLDDEINRAAIGHESLHAGPLRIGQPQAELPVPVVEGESGGVLDPDDVPAAGTRLIVRKYTGQIEKDEVHILWWGSITGRYRDKVILNSITDKDNVPFNIRKALVEGNRGGTVRALYWIKRAAGGITLSHTLDMRIGAAMGLLPPVKDTDGVVSNGELDLSLVPGGFEIEVPAYDDMEVGDNVAILWHADNGSPDYTDADDVSERGKDKPVPFTIPRSVLERSRDANVVITYTVDYFNGGTRDSEEYPLRVVQELPAPLPEPIILEAKGSDILDPADALNGATVQIGTKARLKRGDAVTLYWKGQPGDGTVTKPLVPVTEDDKALDIVIEYQTVIANDGHSIELEYTIKRVNNDIEGPSPIAEYDVRSQVGSGTLKVMGARDNRDIYRASSASRLISAFNSSTGQPLRAEWQYQGDSAWIPGTTWRDSHPEKPLRVRTSDDLVTLNPGNIIGNGVDTTTTGNAAFVAHRDEGDVVGWGDSAYGAAIPPTIITMTDIVEVSCTRSAYAGRRINGHVVVWGNSSEGGLMGGVSSLDFREVVGNGVAFAGIKTDGTVKAWGVAAKGGTVPAPIDGYTDIERVVGASEAFAAQRSTGHVVAWGTTALGGEVPADIAGLTDIVEMIGNFGAFAAWRGNRRLIAWGGETYGSVVPGNIAAMTDIVELSCATAQSFAARRATGQVVAWGTASYGGTVPDLIAGLTDILTVCSTWQSLAALRGNGHVVAWGGTAGTGGVVPDDIARLDDIVQLAGSSKAFAALRKNGTVVAWGDATVGGDTSPVIGQLTNVQAIYDNSHGFVALTSDGRVVSWGHPAGGGDSSSVREHLDGYVSYRATPASRGRALSASRWIAARTARGARGR